MKQEFQRITISMLGQSDAERIGIVRNTFLAAAALPTAILIALTQVGAKQLSLQVAVVGSALSAPIWLCLAVVLEVYLHLGEGPRTHFRQVRTSKLYTWLQIVAGTSLYAALCGIIYFLFPWGLLAFLVASALGAAFVLLSYIRLAKWVAAFRK